MSYQPKQTKMYKTGEAIITKHFNDLLFVIEQSELETEKYFCSNLNGVSNLVSIERPATEAEILAEAEKHGWEKYGLNLEAKYVVLIPYSSSWEWEYSNSVLPSEAGLFGQECITAHRLITALNPKQ